MSIAHAQSSPAEGRGHDHARTSRSWGCSVGEGCDTQALGGDRATARLHLLFDCGARVAALQGGRMIGRFGERRISFMREVFQHRGGGEGRSRVTNDDALPTRCA